MSDMYKQRVGSEGERFAQEFLEKMGYQIIKKNYRYRHKEIDIIAKDKNTIVFVEVKTIKSKKFGESIEKVNLKKRKRIAEVAQAYLAENDLSGFDFRFDVVGVDLKDEKKLVHLPNAFTIDWLSV